MIKFFKKIFNKLKKNVKKISLEEQMETLKEIGFTLNKNLSLDLL